MTDLYSALAAIGVSGALALCLPTAVVLTKAGRSRVGRSEASLLKRFRGPLAGLVGVAAWAFVSGPVGVGAGLAVALVAWRTLGKAKSPAAIRREERLREDYPLVAELLAHALAAGVDIATALRLVAGAVGDPWEARLAICLNGLQIGQNPTEVWSDLEDDPQTSGLGRALARSHATGVPVSKAMRALAQDLREEADLAAHAYARTIEVRAAAPLGVCFLPAFVLLGVVPMVAGILRSLTWAGSP